MGRASAASQAAADSQVPTTPRPARKRIEKTRVAPAVHDIPYFADMQLNPARYPAGKLNQLSLVSWYKHHSAAASCYTWRNVRRSLTLYSLT